MKIKDISDFIRFYFDYNWIKSFDEELTNNLIENGDCEKIDNIFRAVIKHKLDFFVLMKIIFDYY
jgi:hypothetical protein